MSNEKSPNGTLYINGEKFGEFVNAKITMTRVPEKDTAYITIKRERSLGDEIITRDQKQR